MKQMKQNKLKNSLSCLSYVMLAILIAVGVNAYGATTKLTAEQVAQKAASVITTKGLSATFSINSQGRVSNGSVKSAGNKFVVLMPEVSTWYNGKSLYTYNPRTSETTVTIPTAQELAESNPLLYVRSGAAGFTCRFSTVKRQGKYVVDLLPKDKKSGLKKLVFTINSTTFQIEKILVTTASGNVTVDVKTMKTGITIPVSEFEYPSKKYPRAEIVDLR